ncbi:hypothetical protein BJX66DRAFT_316399 [Aspergillus keveii]|uniref:Zn(2)-C6 fungal-type domain-containing protein n=1 Tax=Aspergillus keveii TaxID=714993 RepID=A0ABR4FMZ4_9EURO
MFQQPSSTRQPQACSYCRGRKVKCDGEKPCGNCRDHQQRCVYLPAKRRGRKHLNDRARAPGPLASPTADLERDRRLSHTSVAEGVHDSTQPSHTPSQSLVELPVAGERGFLIESPADSRANPQCTTMEPPVYQQNDPLSSTRGHGMELGNLVLTPTDTSIDREEATIDITQVGAHWHVRGVLLTVAHR